MSRNPRLKVLFVALFIGAANAAEPLSLQPSQVRALGIETALVGQSGEERQGVYPARVLVPNEQMRVVAAPVAGQPGKQGNWFTSTKLADGVWCISDNGSDNIYLVEGRDITDALNPTRIPRTDATFVGNAPLAVEIQVNVAGVESQSTKERKQTEGRDWATLKVLIGAARKAPVVRSVSLATAAFAKPTWVGAGLILTGAVVATTRWLPGGPRGERETGWRQAAVIGLAQGLAVFPGLSRSGTTIAAGLGSGLDRAWAAHFSFLLAVPAILAATSVEVFDAWQAGAGLEPGFVGACAVGVPCAALTGYGALGLVIRSLSSASFHRFAWYCVPLGVAAVLWGLG